jgi:ribose 5-phosphate isomerase B
MKIALGSDHHGFRLKAQLGRYLKKVGHECVDWGTHSTQPVDYPDYAVKVARSVVAGECERGILICKTGIGMSIAANKVRGIRAALCHSPAMARLSRAHNDANVLVLPSMRVRKARQILDVWLKTPFEGGRHCRRIDKISKIEMSPSSV